MEAKFVEINDSNVPLLSNYGYGQMHNVFKMLLSCPVEGGVDSLEVPVANGATDLQAKGLAGLDKAKYIEIPF